MRVLGFGPVLLLAAVLAGCAAPRSVVGDAPESPSAHTTAVASPDPRADSGEPVLAPAGSSPFTGAVVSSSDGRDLVLQITRLPSGGSLPACTGVRWKPVVRESARTVTITLAGSAPRNGSGSCTDGLDAPVPLPVSLSAPLGTRQLVDGSDGTVHPVFDSASMPLPAPSTLPSGVTAGPVRWDEQERVASRRWQSADTSGSAYRDVWISIGPARGVEAGAPLPSRSFRRVQIGAAEGKLWRGGGPYDVVVVRFPRGPGLVEVRVVQAETEHGTGERALRIARALG